MFHGMRAYRDSKRGFICSILVVILMFGLQNLYTATSQSSLPTTSQFRKSNSYLPHLIPFNLWRYEKLDEMLHFEFNKKRQLRAISRPCCFPEALNDRVIIIDDIADMKINTQAKVCCKSGELIHTIQSKLQTIGDGETGISPYDTAWISLIKDANKSELPLFSTAIIWISENQHSDGSWGDQMIFSLSDRIINTLACIISLKTWRIDPSRIERGLKFILDNMRKLEDEEKLEHIPIAFELTLPNLLEMAKRLDIQVPDDSSFIQSVYAMRNIKLERIPKEMMHRRATSLLYTLEGMGNLELDWEKLLRFKCSDGSFLFSPSSTAFAFMRTEDKDCLNYLKNIEQRFQGGAPSVYPIDLFERIWAVDRLQRLGICRHFRTEIRECMLYVYRYWTESGICWARNSPVTDLDDTAMGFIILRQNGFDVSSDVLRNFQNGKEFFCFVGQTSESVAAMLGLYRTSQLQFPGETVMEEARKFSYKFLQEKKARSELIDKWIITKDLPGEVEYALDVPWYASLPRLEARFYLQHYGGDNDVWIAKSLYRMFNVNNDTYLELANLDYNECQSVHQREWNSLEKWYKYNKCCNLKDLGIGTRDVLLSYFLAASTIFEPERHGERISWAKSTVLIESIVTYLNLDEESSVGYKKALFLNFFKNKISFSTIQSEKRNDLELDNVGQGLVSLLVEYLREYSQNVLLERGTDNFRYLCQNWEKWMVTVGEGRHAYGQEGDLLVQTLNMSLTESYEALSHQPWYQELAYLTNTVCDQLRVLRNNNQFNNIVGSKVEEVKSELGNGKQIEANMQQLVMLVLKNSSNSDMREKDDTKQTFFNVARSFYYCAYFDSATVDHHIAKVLFEKVE